MSKAQEGERVFFLQKVQSVKTTLATKPQCEIGLVQPPSVAEVYFAPNVGDLLSILAQCKLV